MSTLKIIGASIGAVLLVVASAACGTESDQASTPDEFGYAVEKPILTTNAGTSLGVATDAARIASRLYPGASIAGPDGQLLPNTDIVTATRATDDPRRVDYVINDDANYSDGKPVVCDDFVLANAASHDPTLFGADMPLYFQVERVDCAAGKKAFAVHFNEGFGDRYMELFTAGTVMPAHVVADRAEVANIVDALASGNNEEKHRIAKAWQDTFNVELTDPATIPTSGPYKIASKGDKGQLRLVANPEYAGQKPAQDPLIVWPGTADVAELVKDNKLAVVDLDAQAKPESLGLQAPNWSIDTPQSERVDTLRLSGVNQLENAEARRAFGECVDRSHIAKALHKATGIDVATTGLRVVPPNHVLSPQLKSTNDAAQVLNYDNARAWLGGQSIRIGYLGSTSRYKIIAQAIKDSCGNAGIDVQPVELTASDYGTLGLDYDILLDTRGAFGRNSSENTNVFSRLEKIRTSEENLQRESMTIPLTTEPRHIAWEKHIDFVTDNGSDAGVSWNMDRWTIHNKD